MSEDILVNVTPQETRVAVVEQGSVVFFLMMIEFKSAGPKPLDRLLSDSVPKK